MAKLPKIPSHLLNFDIVITKTLKTTDGLIDGESKTYKAYVESKQYNKDNVIEKGLLVIFDNNQVIPDVELTYRLTFDGKTYAINKIDMFSDTTVFHHCEIEAGEWRK